MMTCNEIRETFLNFFESKNHQVVPSAPMVVKNDPTLMFINSGMAPFKDIFLGNSAIRFPRVADTQKCLRVSGKHNDLEEVGVDTYHHTMFEMLGNWSFGDYFKTEAIAWAWELLTEVYKIDKDRLYVTVFEGDAKENIPFDQDAFNEWKKYVPEERILMGNKKDNFWEMGEMGPCGPCSEIHYDGRDNEERKKIEGATLVNNDDPQVIEVWNNVFMEFNRKADGSLEKLPAQHVDTGMGFERLVRVLQGKQSNYDTDIFQPIIRKIEDISGLKYRPDEEKEHKQQEIVNIAMRVIADHIRAISFSIADGQLPSNTGAGYVIRRILRRAIRYGYQSLNIKEPFMFRLVSVLAKNMGQAFPELNEQRVLIEKVLKEEELSFFRTLETGLKRIDILCLEARKNNQKILDGAVVFELFDTYGFPIDLTSLIAKGYDLSIDEAGFASNLEKQKERSRAAAVVDTDDWIELKPLTDVDFVGYDETTCETEIVRYRKVKQKNKELFHLVLTKTPFYAESGGQVGDKGVLIAGDNKIFIIDTKRENNLNIHITEKLSGDLGSKFIAQIDTEKRKYTENNHSATHLLHAALRKVLGTHVEQKGSLVNEEHLRFDFSHFAKLTEEQIEEIESIVNAKIRENIALNEQRNVAIADAKKLGAMALFGEKYGDHVRVITFDKNFSVELCGGTHVRSTGQIGLFKLTSEGAVAAGIRRIEAVTAIKAEAYIAEQDKTLNEIKEVLKHPKDVVKSVQALVDENHHLLKNIESLYKEKTKAIKSELLQKIKTENGVNFIAEKIELNNADAVKDLMFQIKGERDNLFMVIGAELNGKATLSVMLSDNVMKEKNLNATQIIKEIAKEINGGGGGQPFYATAGGTNVEGLNAALAKAKNFLN